MRANLSIFELPIIHMLLVSLLNSARSIKATVSRLLKGIALGFGLPRLPIMMADEEENYKDKFKYIVLSIVVLVVGAVVVSIVSGVSVFILGVFNSTVVKIPASYNFVSPIVPTLGSIFQILVVVLIIVALIFVIRYLMRATDTF